LTESMMKRQWTKEEDAVLLDLVSTHGKQWGFISTHIPQRTASQVAARWEKCLDPNLHKGPFTSDEDQTIVNFVSQNGPRGWPQIVTLLPHRSAKQCRERWFNHLDPTVVKTEWTAQEDELIFQQVQQHSCKWSLIAKLFPGRSDNAIKNRWNSSVSKRIVTDESGVKRLTPDSSHRKYKPRERPTPSIISETLVRTEHPAKKPYLPPPLQIPVGQTNTGFSPGISFTPFSVPTPVFATNADLAVFSPTSAFGLQTPGAVFGGIGSPTKTSPMLLSPTKGQSDENM
jgi:hypothetical protein